MKKAALVMEGGANRGVFTAGALDFLLEQDVSFPYVLGVSAGACNAVNFVSRQKRRMHKCVFHEAEGDIGYMNWRTVWKKKSLLDMDTIFDQYANETYPFDYETYFQSSTRCVVATTNCLTGKTEYMEEKEDRRRLMDICRASSSLPLATPMVWIEDTPYLDGGLSDSVPVAKALRDGYKKCVVILTRRKGYRKTVSKKVNMLYIAAFQKYPELLKTLINRVDHYNKTMDLIDRLEEKGHLFVLRPEIEEISRMEKDVEKMEAFYQNGYNLMKERFEEMKEFLGGMADESGR